MRDYEMLDYSNEEWDLILKLNPNFEKNCKNIIREHFNGKIDVKYVEEIYNYIWNYIDLTKACTDDIIHMIVDIYYRHLTNQNVNISEYMYLLNYSCSKEDEIREILYKRYEDDRNKLKNLIDEIQMYFPTYIIDSDKINILRLSSSISYQGLKEELYNLKLCCKLNKKDYSESTLLEMFNLIDEIEEITTSGVLARRNDGKRRSLYIINRYYPNYLHD